MFKVAVLPGDGIGPEVVNEGMKVLRKLSQNYSVQFDFQEMDINSERYLRTGKLLTAEDVEQLKKFDTIYLGAVGDGHVRGDECATVPVRERHGVQRRRRYAAADGLHGFDHRQWRRLSAAARAHAGAG